MDLKIEMPAKRCKSAPFSMKVTQLKRVLRSRRLKTSGHKQELAARLDSHFLDAPVDARRLPLELLQLVANLLDAQTYTRMRRTCKHMMLVSQSPTIDFAAYREYTRRLGNRLLSEPLIRLALEHIDTQQVSFLARNKHSIELIRVLESRKGLLLPAPELALIFAQFATAACSLRDMNDNYKYEAYFQSQEGKSEERIVRFLMKKQSIDPSSGNNWAIRFAATGGHDDLVKMLLADPRVDPSDGNNQAILLAVEHGHTEIVRMLLKDTRIDPSAVHNESIQAAARKGHVEIVKLLLNESRVDASDEQNSAVQLAAMCGHTEIVQLLLRDVRVDPSSDHNFALRHAAYHGHAEVIKLLMQDNRVDPSDSNNQAIRSAAMQGHGEVVRTLLQDKRVGPS